jgi:hypothetical protein
LKTFSKGQLFAGLILQPTLFPQSSLSDDFDDFLGLDGLFDGLFDGLLSALLIAPVRSVKGNPCNSIHNEVMTSSGDLTGS